MGQYLQYLGEQSGPEGGPAGMGQGYHGSLHGQLLGPAEGLSRFQAGGMDPGAMQGLISALFSPSANVGGLETGMGNLGSASQQRALPTQPRVPISGALSQRVPPDLGVSSWRLPQ